MNLEDLSPEERQRRALARKRREQKRYRPITAAKRKAKRHQDVNNALSYWSWVPMSLEKLPNPNLFDTSFAVRRRAVQHYNEMAEFVNWHNTFQPDLKFLELSERTHAIFDPKIRLRAYRPHHIDHRLVVDNPALLPRLYKNSGRWREYLGDEPRFIYPKPWLIEHELDINGVNYCGRCQQKALTVILRPGEDTLWRCWGCGRTEGTMEQIAPYFQHWEDATDAFSLTTGQGRFIDYKDYWDGLINQRLEDLLNFGRIFYQVHAPERGFPVAFGDWAHLWRESLESLPGVGKVSRNEFTRSRYFVRVLRALDGRIATLHIHSETYKPLFTHYVLDPSTPQLEVPWWALKRPWHNLFLTHDRALADRMEREEVRKPLADRLPIGLLPSGDIPIDLRGYFSRVARSR